MLSTRTPSVSEESDPENACSSDGGESWVTDEFDCWLGEQGGQKCVCDWHRGDTHDLLQYAEASFPGDENDEWVAQARKLLREAHGTPRDTDPPLVVAAREGNFFLVQAMLQLGCSPDYSAAFKAKDGKGAERDSPLMAAWRKDRADVAGLLLEWEASAWHKSMLDQDSDPEWLSDMVESKEYSACFEEYRKHEFAEALERAADQWEDRHNRRTSFDEAEKAFVAVAEMYWDGNGTALNRNFAARWYIRAVEVDKEGIRRRGDIPDAVKQLQRLAAQGIKVASEWLETNMARIREEIRLHDEEQAQKKKALLDKVKRIKDKALEKEHAVRQLIEEHDRHEANRRAGNLDPKVRAKEVERCRAVAEKLKKRLESVPRALSSTQRCSSRLSCLYQDYCTYSHGPGKDLPPHCRYLPNCPWGDRRCLFNHLP